MSARPSVNPPPPAAAGESSRDGFAGTTGETLAERYARMAHAYEGRPIDLVLRTLDIAIAGVIVIAVM